MMSLVRLAWRNLGRSRRRTLTTGVSLAFGMCLCIASFGLVDGMNAQMLHALTRLDLGHVQVHHRDFVGRKKAEAQIEQPDAVVEAARANPAVRGIAPRVYAFALVSGTGKSSGIELVGVDPEKELTVTELHRELVEGEYLKAAPTPWPPGRKLTEAELRADQDLTQAAADDAADEIDALGGLDDEEPAGEAGDPPGEPTEEPAEPTEEPAEPTKEAAEPGQPPADPEADAAKRRDQSLKLAQALHPPPDEPLQVILGTSLARVLGVKLGDELYASAATIDGGTGSALLRVRGIYRTGTQQYDRYRVYLHIQDVRRLAHMEGGVHEMAMVLDSSDLGPAVAADITDKLGSEVLLVRSWNVVRPDVAMMMQLNDVSTAIMVFIIFFVATLGVVNTMLMAVFERTRELGVLKAIGMSASRIMALVVTETILMVLVASVVGAALGLALDGYMVRYGVDLTSLTGGFSLGGIGINPVIYGVITVKGVVLPVVTLAITCLLASIYPALRAARMQPAIGMRET
ncbi:MAG: ABC transporter permease [Deltaproteobacteria bacterium]|nr:ABC transporter permease [Deltaproteobacteria bacterium]